MTTIVQRAGIRYRRSAFGLATALTYALTTAVCAEVRVEGNPKAIRITTAQDAISDVLGALAATFNVQYRTAIPLDAAASETYTGSFGQVISRLLGGYNYVIKTDKETVEIVVFGRRGEVAIPAPAAPPPKGILSRWR